MRALPIPFIIAVLCHGAECRPTRPVVEQLLARFRYENGLGRNRPYDERFSLMHVGTRYYLRENTVSANYTSDLRPVLVFEGDKEVVEAEGNCPKGPSWIDCAVYLSAHLNDPPFSVVLHGDEELKYPPSGVNASECDFVLRVPSWQPSPDSPEKRKVASEILSEVQVLYEDARRIVVRDFNLEDPDITAYITDQNGGHQFQGCAFNREADPHCTWHIFGQSPLWALRRQVMSRPYVLYPLRKPH